MLLEADVEAVGAEEDADWLLELLVCGLLAPVLELLEF